MTTAPLRTYRSRPYLVVLDDGSVQTFRTYPDACRVANRVRDRVHDLRDVDAFSEAASNAGDLVGVFVAARANGWTVADIAARYRDRIDPRSIYGDARRDSVTDRDARHVVAEDIRDAIGSLSRHAAQRQVAAWILESACR